MKGIQIIFVLMSYEYCPNAIDIYFEMMKLASICNDKEISKAMGAVGDGLEW